VWAAKASGARCESRAKPRRGTSVKTVKIIVLIIAAGFIALQLVPVKRDNPAGPDTFDAPPEVKRIVVRSCYDCHSNRSRWPWYAYVAPVSWSVAGDVHNARKRLNFSNWSSMTEEKRRSKIADMKEEIESNGMPLPRYLKMHPDARLTSQEKQTIYKWAGRVSKN
jgi:hypothetical protein